MKLRELIKYGGNVLKEAGIEEYESDARLLAMYAFGLDYTGLLMKSVDDISKEDEERYKKLINRRSTHYPCQYIIGTQDFMGYTFRVSENVLIPRPETEILVETALSLSENVSSIKALDMCCGTGCIGLSFAKNRKGMGHNDDRVILVDVSDAAIALTRNNMSDLKLECDIIQSDLFEDVIEEKYDIIMSNPPYISTKDIEELMEDVRAYEPRLALDGMEDGLFFYRRIIENLNTYLAYDGVVIFEIGYNQYEDVRALLVDAGFNKVDLKKDYAGLDRVVIAKR